MIGSGSFACAMLHIVAANVLVHDEFDPQVACWVHDAKALFEVRDDGAEVQSTLLGA